MSDAKLANHTPGPACVMPQTGVRSGILLAVVGLWVVLRSTHQDQSHRTLIDHILGKKASASAAAAAPTGQIQTALAGVNPAALASLPATQTGVTDPTLGGPGNTGNIIAGAAPYAAPPTGPSQGSSVRAGQLQIQQALNAIGRGIAPGPPTGGG